MAYQEHHRDVQQERNHGVDEESKVADSLDVREGHLRNLDDERDDSVHDGASWSEIVERDEWVHLELGAGEETLNHDETSSLKDDASKLEEETNEDKVDLTVGGNHHTNDDEGDVSKSFEVDGRDTKDPGSNQYSDWGGGLISSVYCPRSASSSMYLTFNI
jgi:hypothetical protein